MVVRGRVSSDDSYVYVDPDKVAAFVRAGGGPVYADLDRRASNVQLKARVYVGKDTRRLERSIVKRPGIDARGPFIAVVTEGVPYSVWHHEGNTRGWRGNPFLRDALEGARSTGGTPSGLVSYTTRAGVTRQATPSQVANWTRNR